MNCLLRTVAIAVALTLLLTLIVALAQADTTADSPAPSRAVDTSAGEGGLLSLALVIGVLVLAFGVWLERLHHLLA